MRPCLAWSGWSARSTGLRAGSSGETPENEKRPPLSSATGAEGWANPVGWANAQNPQPPAKLTGEGLGAVTQRAEGRRSTCASHYRAGSSARRAFPRRKRELLRSPLAASGAINRAKAGREERLLYLYILGRESCFTTLDIAIRLRRIIRALTYTYRMRSRFYNIARR